MTHLLLYIQHHHVRLILAFVCVGFFLRLVSGYFLSETIFPDSIAYISAGLDLLGTGQISNPLAMPGYAIWTYTFGGRFGTSVADIIISSITIWLISQLVIEITKNEMAAVIASAISAFYPFFIFYSSMVLTETIFIFMTVLSFILLYRKYYIVAFIIIALSTLVRPTLDLLAPILIFTFVVIVHRDNASQLIKRLCQFLIIYVCIMSPWWAHNYIKYDEFIRLNLGDGLVLYAGNNPLNKTGGGVIDHVNGIIDYDASRFEHLRDDPVIWRNALRDAALAYVMQHPDRFVEMASVKFVRFWRLWPFAPQYQSPLYIIASLGSFGVVLIGTIAYLLLNALGNWRMVLPMVLLAGYLTAVHMVTIGSIRYRLPIEPFMIVLASVQFALWVRALSAKFDMVKEEQ